MGHEDEVAIANIAADQHGLVTRAQLQELGLATTTIRRREAAGLLVAAGSRTWRLAACAPTATTAVAALCLDLGATASHWTAAWLHGLVPPRR